MTSDIASSFCYHSTVTMHIQWQETALVLTANVNGLRGRSEVVKVERREQTVFLVVCEEEYYRSYGNYRTSFQMPENVDVRKMKSVINNGVLTVTVHKVKKTKTKKKKKKTTPPVLSDDACECRCSFFGR